MRASDTIEPRDSQVVPTHCYLCGEPLRNPTSKDHCPPQSLFAKKIRGRYNTNQLRTITVHKGCNASYALDEQYFVATLIPFAPGSEAGDAVFKEFTTSSRNSKRKRRLAEKVLREFEIQPGGVHLPSGVIAKRQDGRRIARVAWKIVRGLYFLHHGEILPETLSIGSNVTAPDRRPSELFLYMIGLADDETHGRYGGVFDYRFRVEDTDFGNLNYWALLIWDRIIIEVYFHDPWSCGCKNCASAMAETKTRAGERPT